MAKFNKEYVVIQGFTNGFITIAPKKGGEVKDVSRDEWDDFYESVTEYTESDTMEVEWSDPEAEAKKPKTNNRNLGFPFDSYWRARG